MIPRSLFHPGCLSVLRHGLLCSISFFFFPPCILLRVELHSSGLILFVLNSRSMERSICKLWKWELLDFYHTEKDKCPTPSQVCHSVQGNKICSETSCRVARSISCHHLKRAWPPSRERNTAAKLFTTQLKKKKKEEIFLRMRECGSVYEQLGGFKWTVHCFPRHNLMWQRTALPGRLLSMNIRLYSTVSTLDILYLHLWIVAGCTMAHGSVCSWLI